jgi:hypothetical protein
MPHGSPPGAKADTHRYAPTTQQQAFYLIGLRTHSIAAFNSDTGYSP